MNHLKYLVTAFLTLTCIFSTNSQTNVSFESQFEWEGTAGNDIWGFSSGGREYAAVGLFHGLSIVDVTTPTAPVELYHIDRPESTWRDLKEYNGFVYAVDDQDGAQMVIIDCTNTTDISHTYWTTSELGDNEFTTCHNIFIDEFGIAYLFGCNNLLDTDSRGALMLDLNVDPLNPVVVGQYTDEYVHDGYVRDNIMWTSQVYDGTQAAVDVSDKSNPQVISKWTTPGAFTHNCWLNDAGTVLFTTDESQGQFVTAYDVTDLSDVKELDRIRSNPGNFIIPHNAFVVGNHVVVSYYTDGVVVIDATEPENLVIVGEYDTSPGFDGGTFDGCWGVYPYLPSGNLLATDMQTGLWVLNPTYARAGYLEGVVTDAETGATLNNVNVDVIDSDMQDESDNLGEYKTGTINFGTFSVRFKKEGYEDLIVDNIEVQAIDKTILDVEMVPLIPFNLEVVVLDATGATVPLAEVSIINEYGERSQKADENAIAVFENVYEDQYSFIAGQWGYLTTGLELPVSGENETIYISLSKGYYDDFLFDYNWEVTSTAEAGNWEWEDPIGYNTNSGLAFEPSDDIAADFGTKCLVTDSDSGFAGPDDVDNGVVTIQSPLMDLSTYNEPFLSFNRWFANGGGQGTPPDDMLVISITNGAETVVLDQAQFGDEDLYQWKYQSYTLTDFIELSDQMRLIISTGDTDESGHLVEAAFDLFTVIDLSPPPPSGINELAISTFDITPNPVQHSFTLPQSGAELHYAIYALDGSLVKRGYNEATVDCSQFQAGIYLVKLVSTSGELQIGKFVKD